MSSVAISLTIKDEAGNVGDSSEQDIQLTDVEEIVNLSADIALARRDGLPIDDLLENRSAVPVANDII